MDLNDDWLMSSSPEFFLSSNSVDNLVSEPDTLDSSLLLSSIESLVSNLLDSGLLSTLVDGIRFYLKIDCNLKWSAHALHTM